MENKRVILSEFVEKYNDAISDAQKVKLIKEIIVTNYSPISVKREVLKVALDKSIVVNDKGIKYIDMLMNKIMFTVSILSLYTNLDFVCDADGNKSAIETYDCLMSSNIIDSLYKIIGADISELILVNEKILDNWYEENTTTKSFVADMVGLFADKSSEIFAAIINFAKTDDGKNIINSIIEK